MDERMDAAMSDMDLVPLLIEVIILHPCFSLIILYTSDSN